MNNEYYGAPTTTSEDFLAHYGVKGMKWGVRKAIQKGSDRALRRQYKKAAKKLRKLEKQGSSGKKYKKRAIAFGAAAAATGTLAAVGTGGVSAGLKAAESGVHGIGRGLEALGSLTRSSHNKRIRNAGVAVATAGTTMQKYKGISTGAAKAVEGWGSGTSLSEAAKRVLTSDTVQNIGRSYHGNYSQQVRNAGQSIAKAAQEGSKKLSGVKNNTIARIGAGAVSAGLAAGSGYNIYRAASAKRKAEQASTFRREMNKAFSGTKYANGMPAKSGKKKRRK